MCYNIIPFGGVIMGNKSISFVEEVEGIKNQINKIDFQRISLKNEKKEKKRKISDFYKPIPN